MTYDDTKGPMRPVPSIDAVLAAHGAGKVLAAAVAALLRGRLRKAKPPDISGLSPHLLRDIGFWAGLQDPIDPLL